LPGWSHAAQQVRSTLTKPGIPRLALCRLNLRILTSLALAW
jgi:hypothetical protein